MIDPDEYYISVSRQAGDDLKILSVVREQNEFDNFRKVIVASMKQAVEIGDRELHILLETTISE